MRKLVTVLLGTILVAGTVVPAGAGPKLKTLGTDPTGDGPPALDLTYLKAGRAGDDLYLRIGVAGMLPAIGGYPEVPGIEWVFESGGRRFIAEAVAGRTPRFFLFELVGNGFEQLESPEGTYDPDDGYITMLVPLDTIGAKKGSLIRGTTAEPVTSDSDVDAHVHVGPENYYPDTMKTTKGFVVP